MTRSGCSYTCELDNRGVHTESYVTIWRKGESRDARTLKDAFSCYCLGKELGGISKKWILRKDFVGWELCNVRETSESFVACPI